MRISAKVVTVGAALWLVTCIAIAQDKSPKQRLIDARVLYYTPTNMGLKSFQCGVYVDWQAMLTRFQGQPVANDNPFLVYLQSAQLSVTDNLNGDGSLQWVDTTTVPTNLQANAKQMQDGMKQMIGGFYQSWNQFMNGGMVPAPDNTTTETANGDGVHLHGTDSTTVFDEYFDQNMLLTSAHVVMPDLDNIATPIYIQTSQGLLVQTVSNALHQPPTGPEQDVSMSVTYATVGSYQLPATLAVTLKGTGEFDFSFNSCTINPTTSTP